MASSSSSLDKVFYAFFLNVSFLMLLLCFTIHHASGAGPSFHLTDSITDAPEGDCATKLDALPDHRAKCTYLKNHGPCLNEGYIDYLRAFYCICGGVKLMGFTLLALWLVVLFYLLGNTASQYFCPSLECLSGVLNLSPTMAGVTLLSLGNGAPDVFASIVSFTASGSSGDVGLNSVLGGAFFVSCAVVGIISICIPVNRTVSVDRFNFLRDVCFLLAALAALVAMLVSGRVFLWEAICFTSLYLVYVIVVSIPHCFRRFDVEEEGLLLPLVVEGTNEETDKVVQSPTAGGLHCFLKVIEMPLYLPRRLTIPIVSNDRWSKPFAVASAILAPLLLSVLYDSHITVDDCDEESSSPSKPPSLNVYLLGGLVGVVLGILASETTQASSPPKRCLLPWVAGGFLMSVVWSYIVAGELVALLVSLGYILGINPSILGFTVLAWGNSIGDLTTNVAMATVGGQAGAQIAFSGCYAGPLFNMLLGLGISLVLSTWSVHPSSFLIPTDASVLEIIGFLIGGLLWAVLMLTRRGMRLDRPLGVGLVATYLCFFCVRISESLGLIEIKGFHWLHLLLGHHA